jgi:hypothetical protein
MVQCLLLFSSKCCVFCIANFFGSCVIHILHTGCAKIEMSNSGAKRLRYYDLSKPHELHTQ